MRLVLLPILVAYSQWSHCLPCGHIYGLSCIKKWLQQSRGSGKCPQCNNVCTLKDVRVLYASRLCVADEELQKRVRSLEAKCAYLEQKAGPPTTDELIDQICSNPAAVQRLATVLAGLYQQPVSP
ncbi:putative transcription factor C2H2 family [Helianthus anomalus]